MTEAASIQGTPASPPDSLLNPEALSPEELARLDQLVRESDQPASVIIRILVQLGLPQKWFEAEQQHAHRMDWHANIRRYLGQAYSLAAHLAGWGVVAYALSRDTVASAFVAFLIAALLLGERTIVMTISRAIGDRLAQSLDESAEKPKAPKRNQSKRRR